ncbi:Down syndrome cell adhesion molecule-like protein 1 homolog [Stylophora pistillata]|nr:Down syndrome cell adhesion molecule-like protein 1 homolog [Stylophora pistillata]
MIVPEHLPSILQCQILGVPPPLISWTMNGQPVNNVSDRYMLGNGSLYFAPPVNHSYAGQYVCNGTNPAGSVSSGAVFFRVAYFAFNFRKNPTNQTAVVGAAIRMPCVPPVSFPVQVTINWYHNYQLVTPSSRISIDNSGTITFTSITKSDEGKYFCDATNSDLHATRTSSVAFVTVYVPPSFQVRPSNTNVKQGSPLMLHCQATGDPMPILTWQKDGQALQTSHMTVLSNGSLFISSAVKQDAGTFSCIASNVASSVSVTAVVIIYVPPSLVSPPENATKIVGETVKFICTFSGIPNPSILWIYKSEGSMFQINQTEHYIILTGSLEIRQIRKRDEGNYICQAKNVAGSLEALAFLRVRVPSGLDMNPMNVTVNESSPASFRCNASGDPKPVVTWFNGQTQLTPGARIAIGEDSLTILRTVASDSGQYSCNVSNGLNSHVGTTYLLVQVPPNITVFHIPRLVKLGESAVLNCSVSGTPNPSVTWYRNGKLLSSTTSLFVIRSIREADDGVYTCIATNAAGRLSKNGNLTVQVVPSPPFPVSATSVSSSAIQLSWQLVFDGHSPITSYKLEMRRESESYIVIQEVISAMSYTVRNLHPFTLYTFRISARNVVGLSDGANVTNRTLQDAPSQPTNLAAATLNATAVTITWDLPATPNGLITRYEIHYNTAEKSDVTSKMLLANQLSVLQASIDSLKPFTRYQFKVRAATEERNVMWGNFSAITEATTGEAAPDAAPREIQLRALSAESIFVTWKSIPSELSNGIIREYIVIAKAAGPYSFDNDGLKYSTNSSLNFTIQRLHPWTVYNVTVQAVTVVSGPESLVKQVRTLEAAPGRPSNVTLDSVSQYSIIVYIAQPLPSERNGVIRGYTVLYRQTGLTEADYLSVNTTSSPLTLANLTVFTEYSIQAAAFTRAGLGTKSEVKTIVTQEGVPSAVDNVTVVSVSYDTITISWHPPVRPNGKVIEYKITYRSLDNNATRIMTTNGSLTTADIKNLKANTTHSIYVTARTREGAGEQGMMVHVTTGVPPPVTIAPTEPQVSPTKEPNTTEGAPPVTEKRTGGLKQEEMTVIIVCVALIVVFLIIAAVYFLVFRRWKDNRDGGGYKRSRKVHKFRGDYEMNRSKMAGFPGNAVLDVTEEPSGADADNSSDSFDSDWAGSTISLPSPPPIPDYAEPDLCSPQRSSSRASDRPRLVGARPHVDSMISQDGYSTVEALGGGVSSFGPPPPLPFRSLSFSERGSDSPGSRKSFTNKGYNLATEREGVDLGEGSRNGFPNRDLAGIENGGYDSDEELDRSLASASGKKSALDIAPPNLDELYAKPDLSKKKKYRNKGPPSRSNSESSQSTVQASGGLTDSFTKPEKSKKTFHKVGSTPRENQSGGQDNGPAHDPVVVYDERTNFYGDDASKESNPSVDKNDTKSVDESNISSATIVSDLNSSEMADPVKNEDLINLSLKLPPSANAIEGLTIQDTGPAPPSPYTLRNRKISLGSQDSSYDEPYNNLEEIDAGITPPPDFNPAQPPSFVFNPEEGSGGLPAAPTLSRSSYPNEPYGVEDKSEEEAVVMEVKEIENMEDAKETEDTINDFDDILNSLLANEQKDEPEGAQGTFTRFDGYDSTVLMF